MKKIEYTKMFKLEDEHFWFVGKRYFVDSILKKYKNNIKTILDLGSGTGGITKHLQKYGTVSGIENYGYAVKLAKKRGLNVIKGDLNNLKVKDNNYDLITIFDVLYHQNIKNESLVLNQCYRALRKRGYLLITDSALDILTSQHDIAVQGKKRYSLYEMRKLVENQGFRVLKASYVYFSLFPLVFIKRLLLDKLLGESTSDVKPVSAAVNKLFLGILWIESIFLKYITFPIGSSLIVLATKK